MLVIHTISCILLLMVILLQPSKSGGLSGMFGGGGTSFFGGKGAAPFLTKVTIVLASVFIITSVILTTASRATRATSAIEKAIEKGEFSPTGWPIPPGGSVITDTTGE
jgi:preprotein translocase subunit SecG